MRGITLFLSICLFSAWTASAQQAARAKVFLSKTHTIQTLAALGIEADHGDYQPNVSFTSDFDAEEIDRIRQAGFNVEVLIPNLGEWYAQQSATHQAPQRTLADACGNGFDAEIGHYPTPVNYTYGSMGGYHTLDEMLAVLDSMRAKFPHLISARAIITDSIVTHNNRPIWWVKISDNPEADEDEPEMLYTALHHAREPNSLSQMLFYMWYLLENYGSHPDLFHLLNSTELYFVPCINPDGYVHNEMTNPQGGGNWRKNRRNNGNGTRGVDINRNYGYQWGIDDIGSSPDPGFATYRGPAPFSEPETRMMRAFFQAHEFEFVLNYHTYSNLLIHPWAYNDELADPAFAEYVKLLTRENHYRAGTNSVTVGYNVNGSSDDWMHVESGAYAMTPEVGPTFLGFWPPADTIDGLNKANMWANLSAAWSLLNLYGFADMSGLEIENPLFDFPVEVTRYGLEAGVVGVNAHSNSPYATITAPAQYQLNLDFMQKQTLPFQVEISPETPFGTTIELVVSIDNGFFILEDTFTKIYYGAPRTIEYATAFDVPNGWEGFWSLTDEDFISAPNCMTDSPYGLYPESSIIIVESVDGVQIPAHAAAPQLQFSTRWHIEEGYDWVQVEAVDVSDETSYLLCGKYTRSGSIYQPAGVPLYHGFQPIWLNECMDLSEVTGKTVRFRFSLYTDQGTELDGFYFDDLSVSYIDSTVSSQHIIGLDEFLLEPTRPNPAHQFTRLTLGDQAIGLDGNVALYIYDAFGRLHLNRNVTPGQSREVVVETGAWPQGVYQYFIQTAKGRSAAQTFTVVHP